MKFGYEHRCPRVSLECESDASHPCSNCVERGFADIFHDTPGSTPRASLFKDNVTRCINYLKYYVATFASALSSPLIYFYNNLNVAYVQYLYLPFLFFFPLYYSSQASTVLSCAKDCKEEYNEWIAVLETRVVNLDLALSTSQSRSDGIELQVLPANRTSTTSSEHVEHTTAPNPIRLPPAYSVSPSLPLVKPLPPVKVVKSKKLGAATSILELWNGKSRQPQPVVSPTIVQMPYTSDDPITRSIAFFSLCRALSGLVFVPIYPIYFRTKRAKSVHSAMLWAEGIEQKQNSFFQSRWIMLSLPAISTTWATFSFVLAIFAYIWRTGAVNDPSDSSSTYEGRTPMSNNLALVLRIVITFITVVDIGCFVGIWRVLKGYSKRIWTDDDGGDAFPMTPRPRSSETSHHDL